jgi:hypothetical protein
LALPSFAAGAVVFGPATYTLSGATTQTFDATIPVDLTSACAKNATYTLLVQNGDPAGPRRITTGGVTLNGVLLAKNPDFSVTNAQFNYLVQVHATNTLHVELDKGDSTGGAPYIVVSVVRRSLQPVVGFATYATGQTVPPVAFSARPGGAYQLVVFNGDADGQLRASSATVTLNGSDVVVSPGDLNQNVAAVVKTVQLGANNTISASVKSSGAAITVAILPLTSTGPVISIVTPLANQLIPSLNALVTGTVTASSSITSLAIQGQAVPAATSFRDAVQLVEGPNLIAIDCTDCDGNVAHATRSVIADTTPPTISGVDPADGSRVRMSSMTLRANITDAGGIKSVTVNGTQVVPVGGAIAVPISFAGTGTTVSIAATDGAGNSTLLPVTLSLDQTPPLLSVADTPAITNGAQVTLSGSASDDGGVVSVAVNGTNVPVTSGSFSTTLALQEGANIVTVIAQDAAGNTATVTRSVNRFTAPAIAIASPANLSLLAAASVTVTGSVTDPAALVTVNGVPALLTGSSFSANVPLAEGGNVITATAMDSRGHIGTASVSVVRDLTPPRIAISIPADGSTVYQSPITVTGLVNDTVVGTVNRGQVFASVNGLPATVSNRTFTLTGISLNQGPNTITASATDVSGNQTTKTITITYDGTARPRIAVASGSSQSVAVTTPVPRPLVVAVMNAAGAPVSGVAVQFAVRNTDGSLEGQRTLTRQTDAAGHAQAVFTTGTWAGAQLVEATAVGYSGTAEFITNVSSGPTAKLLDDSGGNQVGITGQGLPLPFTGVVMDAIENRVANVAVTFHVVSGGGHFPNGQTDITQFSDSDGRVGTTLILGPDAGNANNVVDATVDGVPAVDSATWFASARVAGDPAATTISGTVLDNQDQPVAGVTLRVKGTTLSTQSDASGRFSIVNAPVGTVHLEVDSSTAQRPGTWANLMFMLVTIPGQDNTIDRPIYILPIDLAHGLQVTETTGGTVTSPDVPGLAMTVAPGSVTFTDGSKRGTVSITPVHNDRVPMMPTSGLQPRLVVTIQPAGAHFDPPAPITYPNVDGLPPGQTVDFYSFDHDLGMFVSIGPGTVTDDGRLIVSNPGIGILKAGWHLTPPPPPPPATAYKCSECRKLVSKKCSIDVAKAFKACTDDGDPCTEDLCINGVCTHNPISVVMGGPTLDTQNLYVNRDDPAASWISSVPLPTGQALYASTTSGDLVTWRAYVVNDSFRSRVVNYLWTADGPDPQVGPGGPKASEWHVEGLQWKPGEYVIRCDVTFDNGCQKTAVYKQTIGVRAESVLALGWIDPAHVPLDATGVSWDVLKFFPFGGFLVAPDPVQQVATLAYLLDLSTGNPSRPLVMTDLLTITDRHYILNWNFEYAANKTPPDSFASVADMANFEDLDSKRRYKLFNWFQLKYTVDAKGAIAVAKYIHHRQGIGVTVDPVAGFDDSGVDGPWNGGIFYEDSYTTVHHVNDGTPAGLAVSMFNTLMTPLSWSDIGSKIAEGPKYGESYDIATQVYPTYYIYEKLIRNAAKTKYQAADPSQNFSLNPYPPGPAPFIPSEFTTP